LTDGLYVIEDGKKILYPEEFVKRKDIVKKIIETYLAIYGDIEII
jgi:hypothetical protein